jgi:hypothetical protein
MERPLLVEQGQWSVERFDLAALHNEDAVVADDGADAVGDDE